MRRVLLISFDFPPRGATGVLRITKFARYLPDFGWQPVVLTAAGASIVHDDALLAELPPDLEVIRVADPLAPPRRNAARTSTPRSSTVDSPPRSSQGAMLRQHVRRFIVPDPQITWVPRAVQAATARLRCGDIAAVLTTSPPHSVQLSGLWLKRRFPHIPWIMDLRDLWSDSGTITDPLVYKLNRACERACVQAAECVVVVTPSMRRRMQQEFHLPAERIRTITNGFDRSDIEMVEPPRNAALQIVYVGTLTATRTPAARGLFAALERLAAQGVGHDTLVLHAYGLFDLLIHQWAAPLVERGLVQLHPFVPHAEAIRATAAADVLLLVMSDDDEGRIAMPNKLYEYLAVGRPVFALTPPGEATRLIEALGAGVAVAPGNVNGITAALEQLIAQHRAGALPSVSGDDARIARFERRELAQQLATLLDEVAR